MDERTDEQVIQQAGNPGRVLTFLAVMTSVTLIGLVIIAVATIFTGLKVLVAMFVVVASLGSIAVGYWLLAVAARRGNPRALTIAAMLLIADFLLLVLTYAGTVLNMETERGLQVLVAMVVPLIIAVQLAVKRSALRRLQRRGLWDQVYGAAKPSGLLCILGGILLAIGFVALHGWLLLIG